jgi:virginiamycin B lyase
MILAPQAAAASLGNDCYPGPVLWPQDPAGHVWYTEQEADLGQITPTGTVRESGSGYAMLGVTTGPDGAVWFTSVTSSNSGEIGRIAPDGSVTLYSMPPLPVPGGGFTRGGVLISAGDGFLYTPMLDYPYVARISTSGAVAYLKLPSPAAGMVRGSDGAAWFAGSEPAAGGAAGQGVIGRLGPLGITAQYTYVAQDPAPGASLGDPQSLVNGPDGRLWFTIRGGTTQGSYIGAVTATGQFSFYKVSSSFTEEDAIATGPDRNLWLLVAAPTRILEFSSKGKLVAQRSVAPPFVAANSSMVLGPDGRMWLGDDRYLYAISASGVQTTLYPPASTVTLCGPSFIPVVAGGALSLFGRALDQTTAVTVGGVTAAFRVVSPVALNLTIPPTLPPGETSVVASSATASSTLSPFDVQARPAITSLSPACGWGGTIVDIDGTELDHVTSATVGGTPATITSDKFVNPTETTLQITVPDRTLPGTVDVRLTNIAGTSAVVPADRFTYSLSCI